MLNWGDLARIQVVSGGEEGGELLLRLDSLGLLSMEQQARLAQDLQCGEPLSPRAPIAWRTETAQTTAQNFQTSTLLPTWGHYRNLRLIGEGGMGRIFQAYDPSLKRVVALKILRGDSPEHILRFLLEAQNQAAVEHPNICRVYEVGEWQGYSFIAMQYIEGECLDHLAARLSLRQKVEIMLTVAEAVHAAHLQGLIHRDLKPANILVERIPDGRLRPYVMDFGLSRGADACGLTVTGMVLGTAHYMAPEQARGDHRQVDCRTDVYGLGATFYRVLSGQPPYADVDAIEATARSLASGPVSLRRLQPELPKDLALIVAKCMKRDPGERYPSALALAEDLRRHLEGEPILGSGDSSRPRICHLLRKRKGQVLLMGVSFLLVLVFAGIAMGARLRAARQVRLAQHLALEVTAMESQVADAYRMPLHGLQPEMEGLRRRIKTLQQEGSASGRAAQGPVAYSLGRAMLAAGAPAEALKSLEQARGDGFRTPDSAFRLALACIELECRDSGPSAEARVRITNLLREAQGSSLVSRTYVEALLAFYEGRLNLAWGLAERALREAPELYQARALQAEIRLEEAQVLKEDQAALRAFILASEALHDAQAAAPSDPWLRELECRRWRQEIAWRKARGMDFTGAVSGLTAARENLARLNVV
nr:serine/threonine-protein kinase [uncultured Holophaga sp.]